MENRKTDKPLLDIQDFKVFFHTRKKNLPAVDGVNLTIYPGEIVGVVGESGSGKSVMSQSILRLKEHTSRLSYEGRIIFEGNDLLQLSLQQMRSIRGNRISVIFQDPMSSLSPVHTIGKQVAEVLKLHKKMSAQAAKDKVIELLRLTGIPSPERCVQQYPFELSGGMQQRVMIAMALACEPTLLIADEPTTALDVTIQEQILHLIMELNQKTGMAVLFITHDLGVMAQICNRVCVMYLGQIVEQADTKTLFENPLHPYTRGLLKCIPTEAKERGTALSVLEGTVPSLSEIPQGCHFCTRCKEADEQCKRQEPPYYEADAGHLVKCARCMNIGTSGKAASHE